MGRNARVWFLYTVASAAGVENLAAMCAMHFSHNLTHHRLIAGLAGLVGTIKRMMQVVQDQRAQPHWATMASDRQLSCMRCGAGKRIGFHVVNALDATDTTLTSVTLMGLGPVTSAYSPGGAHVFAARVPGLPEVTNTIAPAIQSVQGRGPGAVLRGTMPNKQGGALLEHAHHYLPAPQPAGRVVDRHGHGYVCKLDQRCAGACGGMGGTRRPVELFQSGAPPRPATVLVGTAH
jgi:hypothetical protein